MERGDQGDKDEGSQIGLERVGVREFIVERDVLNFSITQIIRPAPLPKLLALVDNHMFIHLFNQDFGANTSCLPSNTNPMDFCRLKVPPAQLRSISNKLSNYTLFFTIKSDIVPTECLFMIQNTGEVVVLSDEFYLLSICRITCYQPSNNIKHCLDYEYFEKEGWREVRKIKKGYFVFLFTDFMEWHQVEINTNHKLSKFKPSYKFNLTSLHTTIIQDRIRHPVKLFLLNNNQKTQKGIKNQSGGDYMCLACNCSSDLFLYLISKKTMTLYTSVFLQNVASGVEAITSVEILAVAQRVIVGLNSGKVKIYSFKQENRGKLIVTADVCQSSILSLHLDTKTNALLAYSSSLLSQINIDNMIVQQSYKIGIYLKTFFLSSRTFIALGSSSNSIYNTSNGHQTTNTLLLGQMSLSYNKITEINSNVSMGSSFGKNHLLQLTDNSLIFVQGGKEDIKVIHTYMPPKCISISSVSLNVHANGREEYWFLTDRSEVYKYELADSKVKVAGVISLSTFTDRNQIRHKFKITYLTFAKKTVPIPFDSQITQSYHTPNESTYQQIKPILLGTQTGDLLIVSMQSLDLIIFRLKPFGTPIIYIYQLQPWFSWDDTCSPIMFGTIDKGVITQICSSRLPNQLHRLQFSKDDLRIINQRIFAIISGINFNLMCFRVQINKETSCFRQEHYNPGLMGETSLTTINYSLQTSQQYIVTGYSLGQVIVWRLVDQMDQSGQFHLLPLYLVQNNKEQCIQYAFFHHFRVVFNLGSLLVSKILARRQWKDNSYQEISCSWIKIQKSSKIIQQNLNKNPQKQINKTPQKNFAKSNAYTFEIPQRKTRKVRSNSVGLLDRSKLSQLFHFPDTQLYRSLMKKRSIY